MSAPGYFLIHSYMLLKATSYYPAPRPSATGENGLKMQLSHDALNHSIFTSMALSIQTIKDSLETDGFFDLRDPVAGERFDDMERRKFSFVSAYGLEFFKYIVLHPRVCAVVKQFYSKVTLGHSLLYSEKPGRIFSFRRGGSSIFVPAIHIWRKGSVAEYWTGSRHHRLPVLNTEQDSDGEPGIEEIVEPIEPLWEIDRLELLRAGCKPQKFEFQDGALLIVDAATAFERTAGKMLLNVCFPNGKFPAPAMMLGRRSCYLERKVDELQGETIGANFKFKQVAADM